MKKPKKPKLYRAPKAKKPKMQLKFEAGEKK